MEDFRNYDWKVFYVIYQSTHSDDYLWYLNLCGKNTPENKVPCHFRWSDQKITVCKKSPRKTRYRVYRINYYNFGSKNQWYTIKMLFLRQN